MRSRAHHLLALQQHRLGAVDRLIRALDVDVEKPSFAKTKILQKMEKGVYKCLFCPANVKFVQCHCYSPSHSDPPSFIHFVCDDNRHLLRFENPFTGKCPLCSVWKVEEGEWEFYLYGGTTTVRKFPGRTEYLNLLNPENRMLRRIQMGTRFQSGISLKEIIKEHDFYNLTRKNQVTAAQIEWLKCALRIGRHLINKDVALIIAKLLDAEPFHLICE